MKRTYQPSNLHRQRTHGFRARMALERVVRFSPGAARKVASVSLSERHARSSAPAARAPLFLRLSARPFKPAQRLRQKSEFDRVYRDARRSADALFAIFARNTGARFPALDWRSPPASSGMQSRRNRIKRLVRESFRQHQHELPAVDLVVNARAGARDADNAAITRSLERHWRTVVKQCASS